MLASKCQTIAPLTNDKQTHEVTNINMQKKKPFQAKVLKALRKTKTKEKSK